ncbi:MAG: hypothetical protein HETSPECPRED_009852 [Heterodermia speciosa]|uniref:Uncharacterized protein n=1 Tax=Heterodermia speciosa TaxID=116794 RepID=A0A8H3IZN3_9LECA|nr:MAG: hypothetical protein HETSPECPRED_009852 [Heterodermia speciosa]
MILPSLRSRYVFLPLILALAFLTLLFLRISLTGENAQPAPEHPELKPHPLYKPNNTDIPPPLPEYFPRAASAKSPSDLPPVPSWNRPPKEHVPEKTRLYIGFTRFWPLLQQVVVSYITAGWPPEDIYVVENTGTFDANKHGRLTSQNPFYMDYHRLTKIFGVNVITMPSLQSFAQLQNFYLSEAINNDLDFYFWGHMDVIVQSHEDATPYKSLYTRAVETVREAQKPDYKDNPWAIQFFSYDWFAAVNTARFVEIGGWDTMISYYGTDCDMHSRIGMAGMHAVVADAGEVYDVTNSLDDLEVLYRTKAKSLAPRDDSSNLTSTPTPNTDEPSQPSPEDGEDTLASPAWHTLQSTLKQMAEAKVADPYRNSWQKRQRGGQGEPFYYDPDGFETALQMQIHVGTEIYDEKWGHRGCDIRDVGLSLGDEWRVEHDW